MRKGVFRAYTNSKGQGHPMKPLSLIRAFAIQQYILQYLMLQLKYLVKVNCNKVLSDE